MPSKTLQMLVVSNTSPVSNLAIIGRLALLRARYGRVLIPPMVRAELDALTHEGGRSRIEETLEEGWLKVEPLPDSARMQRLPDVLDPGEVEAIQLCFFLSADKLIIDDALGRAAARALGLRITGLLGELVFGKHAGTIPSVKAEIIRLRTEARFFVSGEIEALILRAAEE